MALEIMRDPRVRSVEWKDLLPLTTWEIVKELLLGLPWLSASLILAHFGLQAYAGAMALPEAQRPEALALALLWFIPSLGCSFIFFLCGLRQVHNAYHYVVGVSRPATEWMMFAISMQMLSSMHALQQTHLHHHSHCMDDEDAEAASARMKGWQAILFGPYFYYLIHAKGIELANPRQKRWIAAEFICLATWVGLALFVFNVPLLKYHVIAMLVGQCLTAFFAVWTVHHDCDRSHFIARTLRNRLKSLIAFDMFFHLEHHLYPKVPTCHLHKLADRLDAAAPELSQKQVY